MAASSQGPPPRAWRAKALAQCLTCSRSDEAAWRGRTRRILLRFPEAAQALGVQEVHARSLGLFQNWKTALPPPCTDLENEGEWRSPDQKTEASSQSCF